MKYVFEFAVHFWLWRFAPLLFMSFEKVEGFNINGAWLCFRFEFGKRKNPKRRIILSNWVTVGKMDWRTKLDEMDDEIRILRCDFERLKDEMETEVLKKEGSIH